MTQSVGVKPGEYWWIKNANGEIEVVLVDKPKDGSDGLILWKIGYEPEIEDFTYVIEWISKIRKPKQGRAAQS